MERESKILVPNGLNDDFYSNLQEQDMEDVMFDQMLENQMEQQMIDQMLEDQMEDQMIDQMLEDQKIDQMLEDQMIDQMLEDQLVEQMLYSRSAPDEQVDYWIAIYNDYSTVTSKDRSSLSTNNLLFYIHKEFFRASKTGKTAYFDFHILDKNFVQTQLKIGDYYCETIEPEHWASWEYSGLSIFENHFLINSQKNNNDFRYTRSMIYPIDYTFASIIPLSNCNPKRFYFKKLNFLRKGDTSRSGDKLSRLIIKNAKGCFFEISIFEFEKNIISLLKELNESYSFMDFVMKKQIEYATNFLDVLNYKPHLENNSFNRIAYENITEATERLISDNFKYLPRYVKENANSEVNILINKFKELKY